MLDWRTPTDYEYTAGLTLHQWAWEFLRRNPEYRSKFFSLPDAAPDKAQDYLYAVFLLGQRFGIGLPMHPDANATDIEEIPWLIGTGVRLLWEYGTFSLGNPRKRRPPWPGYPLRLALGFDLREAVEPQLKHAERLHSRYRELLPPGLPPPYKPNIKPQRDRFPIYVRALDGREAGASQREIGGALYPESNEPRDVGRKALERADKLSLGGYRDLLYLPDT